MDLLIDKAWRGETRLSRAWRGQAGHGKDKQAYHHWEQAGNGRTRPNFLR